MFLRLLSREKWRYLLLTLDRGHFLSPTVGKAGLPFLIMTPGDFLRRLVSE